MRLATIVLALLCSAAVAQETLVEPPGGLEGPRLAPVVALDPFAEIDPRFYTLSLEAELGLVPHDLRIWYLPPIHAADLPRQAYGGRFNGRLFIPRGNSPFEFVFDPYLAGYYTRRLYFPTGFHARLYHGQFKYNRPWRLLIVDRDHVEPWDPAWELQMRRTKMLKAVADLELREGRPLHAALTYWTQVLREPDDAAAHLGLADALLFLQNYDFAGEMVREALRMAPRWLEADIDKRGFLDDPAPLMEAIEKLEKHVARLPDAPGPRFLLGYNLLFTGRAAEAIAHLEAAARGWNGDPVPAQALRAARERAAAGKR